MRLDVLTLAAALLVTGASISGCASKATEEECRAACENVGKVAMGDVNAQLESNPELKEAGESGKELAGNLAGQMAAGLQEECEEECRQKGTKKQAQCLAAAKTVADIKTCN